MAARPSRFLHRSGQERMALSSFSRTASRAPGSLPCLTEPCFPAASVHLGNAEEARGPAAARTALSARARLSPPAATTPTRGEGRDADLGNRLDGDGYVPPPAKSRSFTHSPSDPLTVGASAALLLVLGALAGYLPARGAASLQPMDAPRGE
jgi:hypothetical protein